MKDDGFDALTRAVNKYLKAHGWEATVAGPCRIEAVPSLGKYRFQFVMEFLGGKKTTKGKKKP